ncbi:replication initiation protein [Escherichia coli]|nr:MULTISPECIES: replication initiation protein [Gammaproteobacteria]EKK3968179.1 replication initiation protein [Salmonella enterica]HDE1091019.1 replication initiation protein [Klebsiella quasipneumoniae]HED3971514.1 replication initiation protein [Citrobacter freundii]EEW0711177.1 RepB family plasmid replication initiator protein [Escherichia coli]EEW4702619.1 RepB family plasmid replication initiator protein [Escherichia coli]
MAELVVFKANELAVSRYDLTEHETKLILFCVAKLNPSLETPDETERTVKFSCSEYASFMGISYENAWGRLNTSTRELFKRSIELIYPTGAVSMRVFNWAEYAEFNRETQEVTLVFSKYIIPLLFHLKRFIKYNLDHVKSFENKYSMRIYEWLLKELTQRKTHKANISIRIDEFKFMLMLENSYPAYKLLNHWVLKPISKDLNSYSNMKLAIEKRGRPADTLIFQVELDKQIDLVTELAKEDPATAPEKTTRTPIPVTNSTQDSQLHNGLKKTLHDALTAKIQLTSFEAKFLSDMQSKHDLNDSFTWLTQKQRATLEKILAKYGRF